MDVSVVVIAKNEASNIRRCLESLAGFEDVVVIDDDSSDETPIIAASLGARVIRHRFESFAAQRNWALENAALKHPWVLMLDADEALTPAAEKEMASAVAQAGPHVAGFLLCRKTIFFNRWLRHADGFPVWIMRLVRRGRARFVDSGHGEVPAPPVDGTLLRIREPFLHWPFSRGLSDWLARHNHYSSREAEMEFRARLHWTWRDILRGDGPSRRKALRNLGRRLPCRPFLRFCYHFFWRGGLLDGRAGLVFSLLMANYEAMIGLKRWEQELQAKTASESDVPPAKAGRQ
jgi:glycosyltransferase involved in cell wall biosynthesis